MTQPSHCILECPREYCGVPQETCQGSRYSDQVEQKTSANRKGLVMDLVESGGMGAGGELLSIWY
jgi:hypothetical protein